MSHTYTQEPWSQEMHNANASRIVACVNACAGIPTETLKANADNGKPIFELLIKQRDELQQQRDTLMAAIRAAYDVSHSKLESEIILAAAIASIESQTQEQSV